ncbi:MAG: hypothetical protein R3C03_22215 [Pirellulaceae bacterium]
MPAITSTFPAVPTQIQLWIRELRWLCRTVHQTPIFNCIDEPSHGIPSLPTFHCGECGWVGLRDPEKDNEIGAAGASGFQLLAEWE